MSLTASENSRGPSGSPCRTSEEDYISSSINNADGVEWAQCTSLQIPGQVVMLISSIWSLRSKFNAFHMSIFSTMSCGRALQINFWFHGQLPLLHQLHRNQLVLGGAAPRLWYALVVQRVCWRSARTHCQRQ